MAVGANRLAVKMLSNSITATTNNWTETWSGTTEAASKEIRIFQTRLNYGVTVDWVFVRKAVATEPTFAPYTSWSGSDLYTVTNHPGVGYQGSFDVAWKTGFKNDFSDLRISDGNGRIVPYWIEEKVDGSTAKVWVKFVTTSTSIYVHYGKSDAVSESNGLNVFPTYFDKDTISGWTLAGTTNVVTNGEYLQFTGSGATDTAIRYDVKPGSTHYIAELRFVTASIGNLDQTCIMLIDGSTNQRKACLVFPAKVAQSTWQYQITAFTNGGAYTEGTEYILKIDADDANSSTGTSYYLCDTTGAVLSSAVGQAKAYNSPTAVDGIGIMPGTASGTMDARFKYVFFHPYVATEPTFTLEGGSQNLSKAFSASSDIQLNKPFSALADISVLKPFSTLSDIFVQAAYSSINDVLTALLAKAFSASSDIFTENSFASISDVCTAKGFSAYNDVFANKEFASTNDIFTYKIFASSNDVIALLLKAFSASSDIQVGKPFTSSSDIFVNTDFSSYSDIIGLLFKLFSFTNDVRVNEEFSSLSDIGVSHKVESTSDIQVGKPFTSSNDIFLNLEFSSYSDIIENLLKLFSSSNDVRVSSPFSAKSDIHVLKAFSSRSDIILFVASSDFDYPLTITISKVQRTVSVSQKKRQVDINQ
ncbi:MAG TPA: DUF2341 domain-containing protein [Chitinispirillaceae bacterium]|nr:DUF2341 domain-containing protein [Chitinispirillaceae bacterium]